MIKGLGGDVRVVDKTLVLSEMKTGFNRYIIVDDPFKERRSHASSPLGEESVDEDVIWLRKDSAHLPLDETSNPATRTVIGKRATVVQRSTSSFLSNSSSATRRGLFMVRLFFFSAPDEEDTNATDVSGYAKFWHHQKKVSSEGNQWRLGHLLHSPIGDVPIVLPCHEPGIEELRLRIHHRVREVIDELYVAFPHECHIALEQLAVEKRPPEVSVSLAPLALTKPPHRPNDFLRVKGNVHRADAEDL
ncbi:hypothetical protein ACLOJK_014782 [Asimina triloba]